MAHIVAGSVRPTATPATEGYAQLAPHLRCVSVRCAEHYMLGHSVQGPRGLRRRSGLHLVRPTCQPDAVRVHANPAGTPSGPAKDGVRLDSITWPARATSSGSDRSVRCPRSLPQQPLSGAAGAAAATADGRADPPRFEHDERGFRALFDSTRGRDGAPVAGPERGCARPEDASRDQAHD